MAFRKTDHGTDLLTEFHETMEDLLARAGRRTAVVLDQLSALQEEHKDLREIAERHQAATS